MKYNIGDKVKVREDLKFGEIYGGFLFTSIMCEYVGESFEISEKTDEHYELNGMKEGTKFFWTDEMLEPVVACFKVKCIKSETENFLVGNVYDVKSERISSEGSNIEIIGCFSVEDVNERLASQFELVEESEPVESVVTEDEHGTLHIQFEEKDNIPKLKSEPNYKELYEKAMDELQAMEQKNIPRDNYARIGDAVVSILEIHKKEIDFEYNSFTIEMLEKIKLKEKISDIMWSAALNDLSKIQMSEQICKLTSEIEKLTEINRSLVRSKVNNDDKIEQLKKCLKKQYKFIDKLLPERIEV